jgi:hypothetical protein
MSRFMGSNESSSGEQMAALIQQRLKGRSCVRGLQVVVCEEGIILRGQTGTYYGKQLVQHALLTLTAMPLLANEIEVG